MKTAFINYYDEITPSKTTAFMGACTQLVTDQSLNLERLYFMFASSGGHVDSGIALYNFLRALRRFEWVKEPA